MQKTFQLHAANIGNQSAIKNLGYTAFEVESEPSSRRFKKAVQTKVLKEHPKASGIHHLTTQFIEKSAEVIKTQNQLQLRYDDTTGPPPPSADRNCASYTIVTGEAYTLE